MAAPFPSPTKIWHTDTYASISPSRPELSAKGKTILITGGGTGIGASTACAFAEAGAARIAILGRRKQPLLDTKASIEKACPGTEVFTASVDVTDKSAVDGAFKDFLGEDEELDVVVSNAGMVGPIATVADVDAEKFMATVVTTVSGALNVGQAFLRYAKEDAVAIEVNSCAAHVNFGPGFAAYETAKLAAFRVWDALGFENPGFSVFHTQPGTVDTDMNKEAGGVAALGFADEPALPGDFHLWLASAEARPFKGKYLWVNWDIDELKSRAQEIQSTMELSIQLVGWPFGFNKSLDLWDSEKQQAATNGK